MTNKQLELKKFVQSYNSINSDYMFGLGIKNMLFRFPNDNNVYLVNNIRYNYGFDCYCLRMVKPNNEDIECIVWCKDFDLTRDKSNPYVFNINIDPFEINTNIA